MVRQPKKQTRSTSKVESKKQDDEKYIQKR